MLSTITMTRVDFFIKILLNDLVRINAVPRLFFILVCHLAGIFHSCGNSHLGKNICL